MLTLSQDDRDIIARYPLNGSLDFLRTDFVWVWLALFDRI